jgi:hypothetical protein
MSRHPPPPRPLTCALLPLTTPAPAPPQLGRLPTLYNADLGLFIVNSNRWTLPPQEIRRAGAGGGFITRRGAPPAQRTRHGACAWLHHAGVGV